MQAVVGVDPTLIEKAAVPLLVAIEAAEPPQPAPAIVGAVTFKLYGPDDPNCTGTPVYTDADKPVSAGLVSSGEYTPTSAGVYNFQLSATQ